MSVYGDKNPSKRPEVRAKISRNNGMKRDEVRMSRMGKGNGNNTAIFAILPDGTKKEYDSIACCVRDAWKSYGVKLNETLVSKVCSGVRPHNKNWIFGYL